MPFVYRLQKILDFRIRKKEEQLLVVQKAQQAVYVAEQKIRENEAEIQQTIQNKRNEKDFRMMEYYDKYLHHLWDKADALEAERARLQAILDEEKQKALADSVKNQNIKTQNGKNAQKVAIYIFFGDPTEDCPLGTDCQITVL